MVTIMKNLFWWKDGVEDDVPLWWRIIWPAAWLWEQVSGYARQVLGGIHLWRTIPDDAGLMLTPQGWALLHYLQAGGEP